MTKLFLSPFAQKSTREKSFALVEVVPEVEENSIEIKAFSKDKAYFKFLPIALPLLGYKLLKEKLILELGEREK